MKINLSFCLVCCTICAALLVSCATDAYDKGEGDYSQMQAEMAMVYVDKDLRATSFVTDDGEKLSVNPPFAINWTKTPDSTYRAVTYFSKKENGTAEVKGMSRVGVITPKKQKDMKTDPVRFESAWMSCGGKYLNAGIYLLLGSTDDEKAIHTLGCHIDTLQGGVPEYYSQRTYVSIPLDNAATDSVCLTIHTYDGIVRKTFKR